MTIIADGLEFCKRLSSGLGVNFETYGKPYQIESGKTEAKLYCVKFEKQSGTDKGLTGEAQRKTWSQRSETQSQMSVS